MCTGLIHLLPALFRGDVCGFFPWEVARTRGTANRVRAWVLEKTLQRTRERLTPRVE